MGTYNKPMYGLAVDASTINHVRGPGKSVYRGVDIASGLEVFHYGPYEHITSNAAEFLALVEGLKHLSKLGDCSTPIYSDSQVAILWVTVYGHSRVQTPISHYTSILLFEAEAWLRGEDVSRVYKWDTKSWGINPADLKQV